MTNKRIAAGLFLTHGDKVLLLKRSKKESHAGSWGLPGGKGNTGESFLDCAKREAKEETGRVPDFKVFGHLDEPIINGTYRTFICKIDKPYKVKLSSEHTEYSWVSFKDCKKLDVHPSIKKNLSKFIAKLAENKIQLKEALDHVSEPEINNEAIRILNRIGIEGTNPNLVKDLSALIAIIHPKLGVPGIAYFNLWKEFCNEVHRYVYKKYGAYNQPEENRILEKAGDPLALWHTLHSIWGGFNPKAMIEDSDHGPKGRDYFLHNSANYKKETYRYGDSKKTPSVWGKSEAPKEEEKTDIHEKSVLKILNIFKNDVKDLTLSALKLLADNISTSGNLPIPSTKELKEFFDSLKPAKKPDTLPPLRRPEDRTPRSGPTKPYKPAPSEYGVLKEPIEPPKPTKSGPRPPDATVL